MIGKVPSLLNLTVSKWAGHWSQSMRVHSQIGSTFPAPESLNDWVFQAGSCSSHCHPYIPKLWPANLSAGQTSLGQGRPHFPCPEIGWHEALNVSIFPYILYGCFVWSFQTSHRISYSRVRCSLRPGIRSSYRSCWEYAYVQRVRIQCTKRSPPLSLILLASTIAYTV